MYLPNLPPAIETSFPNPHASVMLTQCPHLFEDLSDLAMLVAQMMTGVLRRRCFLGLWCEGDIESGVVFGG
jgi:hypothetical protein